MTVHVLGQTALGFAVSVPQILSAVLAAGALEAMITAWRRRALVWPASAMLTGSGVGLILRVPATAPGDHWSWHAWWLFATVAAASVLSKHVVRRHGAHVFNPSNLGLVVAFVVLGATRAEPLPFRWGGPLPALVLAYAVIVGGGVVITRRLGVLGLSVACWATCAAGLGALALSGHCMVVPWSPVPQCDGRFWAVVLGSPELFVFLLFMVTDPRTVPKGRSARIAFGVAVGALATLLIAPQRTEFGTKVALLGALTLTCALVPLVAWCRPRVRVWATAWSADQRGAAVGLTAVAVTGGLVMATVQLGAHARTAGAVPVPAERLPRLDVLGAWTPPADLPAVTADGEVAAFGAAYLDPSFQREIAVGLARALWAEREIVRRGDLSLLDGVDHGARLVELRSEAPVDLAVPELSAIHLVVAPGGGHQSAALLGAEVTGVRRAADGAVEPWSALIALRMASDGRWLIASIRPH